MMKKRLTAAIAVLCLVLTLLPLNVWAAEGDTSTGGPANFQEANSASELQNLITAKTANIKLVENADFTTTSLEIPEDYTGVLDLNGKHITSFVSSVVVKGHWTVMDSTAREDELVVGDENTVTYQFGSIRASDDKKRDAIHVQDGGVFVLKSGTVCSATNIAICAEANSTVTIDGGYVEAQEFAVLVRGQNAKANINGGILLGKDNAAVAGNGLSKYAGTEITISGGTLVSKITTSITSGYIPCGIYHPQEGTLNVTGGEIRAPGGVGILMRGGSLTIGENMTKANFVVDSTEGTEGKVGDASREIKAGDIIAMDRQGGYYDGTNVKVTLTKAAEDEEALRPTAYFSDGLDLALLWTTQADNTTVYTIGPKTAATYTVTFDSQDGSTVAPKSVKHGSKVTKPDDPTRTGYTFGGWYKEAACTNQWNFTSDTVTSNITLYAKWTVNGTTPPTPTKYTVTFDSQGGSTVEPQSVEKDGKVTEPAAPTLADHTFAGWFRNKACTNQWNFATDTVTSNITLYAKWTPVKKNYTITLNANGGTLPEGQSGTLTTNDDGKLTALPAAPTRPGYTFDKWTTSTGVDVTADLVFDSNTTIYAQWKKADGSADDQIYTISFDLNYTGAPANPAPISTDKEHKLTQSLPTVSREGYSFDGWYTDEMGKVTDSTLFYASITLKAKWTENPDTPKGPFTITLDANGGISAMKTVKTGNDGKLNPLPKDPTRSGYSFDGWYTEKTDGTKIITSYTFSADTTIYAHWEKDTDTSDPSGDYYHIDYPDRVTGGTFDVSHNRAREGTRIIIELSPRSNYELDELEVVNADTGETIRCRERYTDEYTFTMPDSDVEIFLSYQRRDSGGGGYYVPAEPVTPMTGWYCQNGHIYTAAGELMPDRTPLTRDMLLSILYNREGGGTEGHQTWATKNGIVPDYYEGGYYGTDKPLTREQTAMILYCYARYKNYNTSQRARLTGYSDYKEIRPMAQTAMSWARGANLMTGTTSTTLSPTANLTCGQACVLLQRFAANVSWGW